MSICPLRIRSQLNELSVPLRQAFAYTAGVDRALLEHAAGGELDFSQRGLPLPAGAFKEKAADVDQALGECVRIVGVLRNDVDVAEWSRLRRQRHGGCSGRGARHLQERDRYSADGQHDDGRPGQRSSHAITLQYKASVSRTAWSLNAPNLTNDPDAPNGPERN